MVKVQSVLTIQMADAGALRWRPFLSQFQQIAMCSARVARLPGNMLTSVLTSALIKASDIQRPLELCQGFRGLTRNLAKRLRQTELVTVSWVSPSPLRSKPEAT